MNERRYVPLYDPAFAKSVTETAQEKLRETIDKMKFAGSMDYYPEDLKRLITNQTVQIDKKSRK